MSPSKTEIRWAVTSEKPFHTVRLQALGTSMGNGGGLLKTTEIHLWTLKTIRTVWRYERGNQNQKIEGHTTQWPKEKGQKDKQQSPKHYLSWYDIPELVVPIRISFVEDYCKQGSYWTKGSYWLSWSHHFGSFTVVTMTWLTVMKYLCHKWPRICSTCRKHFPVLSSFMTYHRGL